MNPVTKVYVTQIINTVANAIIGVYIPAYLLTMGMSLTRVITFFVIVHLGGVIFCYFALVPMAKKWGILHTFRLAFPVQILSLLCLALLKNTSLLPEFAALLYGIATYMYWIPMNIFLIKFSGKEKMGENIAKFFALPNLFSIVGPLLGAFLVPHIGFWLVFLITAVGILISYIPLAKIPHEDIVVETTITQSITRIKKDKLLFLFEFFDNVLEESQWFWSIYVFLLIGSLSTPGFVGSLTAIGGSLFTLFVGKFVGRHGHTLIPFASGFMILVFISYMIIHGSLSAYIITLIGSFGMSFFLVTYFQSVYKKVKHDNEEEFMLAREIPVVVGRLVVFAGVLLTVSHLQLFFLLPFGVTSILLILSLVKGKSAFVTN